MHRLRQLLLIACGVAVGCGTPAPPTLDAADEREYERQQKEASAAEGKGQPKGKKAERNAADD